MAYKALYRTYRPQNFSEVIGQEVIVKTLQNSIDTGKISHAYLFSGPRGTGKTTIARIFADILCSLEVLPLGHLVEVSRKDLVAGYVGQTAIDVERCVNRAMGGILFIDEAYSLKNGDNDQFGQEAIDTLLKLVEDNRGKLVAIAAGYTKEMNEF